MRNENIICTALGIAIALLLAIICFIAVEFRCINSDVAEIKTEVQEVKKEVQVQEKVLEIVIDNMPELTIEEQVEKASKKWKVDYKTLRAIVKVESKDDKDALHNNWDGTFDYGYCQVNLSNKKMLWDNFGLNCHEHKDNIECGAILLKGALQKAKQYADGDLHFALMTYNCGLKRARELWESGIHETDYSKSVIRKMEAL